jgi:hypothetical protein
MHGARQAYCTRSGQLNMLALLLASNARLARATLEAGPQAQIKVDLGNIGYQVGSEQRVPLYCTAMLCYELLFVCEGADLSCWGLRVCKPCCSRVGILGWADACCV